MSNGLVSKVTNISKLARNEETLINARRRLAVLGPILPISKIERSWVCDCPMLELPKCTNVDGTLLRNKIDVGATSKGVRYGVPL